MRQALGDITLATRGQGLYECTDDVARWCTAQNIANGLLTLFIRHTSASLLIQENADADVMSDLNTFFKRLVVEDTSLYVHTAEGPDDMPAHIRAALTCTSLSVPVRDGALQLGTWQGIYVFEHRRAPQRRHLSLHVIGL